MRFVLVTGRAPLGGSTCAHCKKPLTSGYVLDLPSRRPYCDHACFVLRNMKINPANFWLGAGIESLPFGSLYGWDFSPKSFGR